MIDIAIIIPGFSQKDGGKGIRASAVGVVPRLRWCLDQLVEQGFHNVFLVVDGPLQSALAAEQLDVNALAVLRWAYVEDRFNTACLIEALKDLIPNRCLLVDSDAPVHVNFRAAFAILPPEAKLLVACLEPLNAERRAGGLNWQSFSGFAYLAVSNLALLQVGPIGLRAALAQLDAAGSVSVASVPGQNLSHLSYHPTVSKALWPSGRPCVFLDRDGVLNQDTGYPHKPEDLMLIEGAGAAVRRLNDAGYLVVVVTNQSGIGRGYFNQEQVEAFHRHLNAKLAEAGAVVHAFYMCPFHPEAVIEHLRVANHPERKPNPGMINRAIAELAINPELSFLIGDKSTDIEAATQANIKGYLFDTEDLSHFVSNLLVSKNFLN